MIVVPEGVALVRLAAHLLDGVLAVRERAPAVVGAGGRAVLAEPEPDAARLVDVGAPDGLGADERVVRVGVADVAVPARRGVERPVAVGHGHVRLSLGDVGDEERHVAELAGRVRALLLQVDVVPDDAVAPREGGRKVA